MARNCQLWTRDFDLLAGWPNATVAELNHAEAVIWMAACSGIRFQFPAAAVGRYEAYWQRPVCAYLSASGEFHLLPDAPLGVLTAYDIAHPDLSRSAGTLAAPAEATALFFCINRLP